MRRTWRWIFNGLTVLSLGLCMVTGMLWVRSYQAMDAYAYHRGRFEIDLLNPPGQIALCRLDLGHPSFLAIGCAPFPDGFTHTQTHHPDPLFRSDLAAYLLSIHYHPFFEWGRISGRFSGFKVESPLPNDDDLSIPRANVVLSTEYDAARTWGRGFAVPCWLPLTLFALLPLGRVFIRGVLMVRRIAVQPGCCSQCGYDLRATPDRCLECGTAVTPPTPTTVADEWKRVTPIRGRNPKGS